MVSFKSFITAAVLSGVAFALPRPQQPDSAIGIEVAVSAPNGIPITDTVELASQSAFEAAQAGATGTATEVSSPPPAAEATPPADVPVDANNQYNAAGEWQQPPPNQHDTLVASSSSSAWVSYSTPAYGSGQSNWGGSGYDDCVNQCIASYGSPSASYAPTATSGSSGPTGTGATHTVVVAPSQGVLRFVPFALNATVGDTIKFIWGANNHTVTRGTELTPCNRSAEDFFASGLQNKDFVYTQVINDTSPIYYYCAAPNHCQRGMFAVLNPTSSFGAPTSVSGMMQTLSESNPDVAAYVAYSRTQTEGNDAAARWGSNIDMSNFPEWSHEYVAENVLYTRNFLAANREVLREDGSIDLSSADSTPLIIPQDLSDSLNNVGSSPAPAPSAVPNAEAPEASIASQSPAPSAGSATSGALSLSSSRMFVGAVVVIATFFAL